MIVLCSENYKVVARVAGTWYGGTVRTSSYGVRAAGAAMPVAAGRRSAPMPHDDVFVDPRRLISGGAQLLAADLRALLPLAQQQADGGGCPVTTPDVRVVLPAGGSETEAATAAAANSECHAHRSLLWARVPHLRPALVSPAAAVVVELPAKVGMAAFAELALPFLYTGELPRGRLPLSDGEARALLALAEAWGLVELRHCTAPGGRGGGGGGAVAAHPPQLGGGLLGVCRPEVEALRADLVAAFDGDDLEGGSCFIDVRFLLGGAGEAATHGELVTEAEPEPEAELEAEEVVGSSRAILCCRSGFFRAMLGAGAPWREAADYSSSCAPPAVPVIPLGLHPAGWKWVNRFLHTGELSLHGAGDLREAVALADYLDIPALLEGCVDWLVEALDVENCCELWNVVASTSLGSMAQQVWGAAGTDTAEREDLLGNPTGLCCDFVTKYFSAVVQTDGFLQLGGALLLEVLRPGLVTVPTQPLMEAVRAWVDNTVSSVSDELGPGALEEPPRKEALMASLLPPATLFNRSTREILLGVGRRNMQGPRSLV
jgi:hypothetical protein